MFGSKKNNRVGGWMARNRHAAPIAADFGRSSVRLLQLDAGSTEYRCASAAEIPGSIFEGQGPRLDSDVMAGRIQDTIHGLGFAGKRISATLPSDLFQTDVARLPAMSENELAESVRFEATDRFGIDAKDFVLGHLRLGGTAGGSNDVLMMAVAREAVDRAAATLSSSNTLAFRVEHAALSALRAITRQRTSECAEPQDSRDYALLHLEDRIATLILLRDGSVSFLRAIRGDWAPAGMTLHRITRNGRNNQDISLGETTSKNTNTSWRWCGLAEETLRCLRHFERGAGGWWPSEIVLTGPAATDPQASATIESVCGARAALAVPSRIVSHTQPCVHGNTWIAAIGAACAELPALARNCRPQVADEATVSEHGLSGTHSPTRVAAVNGILLETEPKPITVHGHTKGAAA